MNGLKSTTRLRVPFHDTDAMGVVWHGNVLKYFEIARCDLLRKIDLDLPELARRGYLCPVIRSSCRHGSPLRYGMEIEVDVEITEFDFKLILAYAIRETGGASVLAGGVTEHVVVRATDMEPCLPVPAELQSILAGKSR